MAIAVFQGEIPLCPLCELCESCATPSRVALTFSDMQWCPDHEMAIPLDITVYARLIYGSWYMCQWAASDDSACPNYYTWMALTMYSPWWDDRITVSRSWAFNCPPTGTSDSFLFFSKIEPLPVEPCVDRIFENQLSCPEGRNTSGGHCYITACFNWKDNHSYNTNDAVEGTDSKCYICILSHTSSGFNRPITGPDWTTYWVLKE